MLDVEKAKKELSEKSLSEIQHDTAWTWASRAVASFENVLDAVRGKKLSCFIAGTEYYHEAIEHASLVEEEDKANLVEEIKEAIGPAAAFASEDIEESLDIEL